MAEGTSLIGHPFSTIDSPKVAKARLPLPIQGCVAGCFFVQVVTFLTIVW